MTTMIYTDEDLAAARAAIKHYLADPDHDMDGYGVLLEEIHDDIAADFAAERISWIKYTRQSQMINCYFKVLDTLRSETEPVSAWATTERTASGPLCVHCSTGRGADRKVVRHASAEQLRRCDDIQRAQRAEELAHKLEQAAERAVERHFEERGAWEPDEPASMAW